jgi:hypothetical protein
MRQALCLPAWGAEGLYLKWGRKKKVNREKIHTVVITSWDVENVVTFAKKNHFYAPLGSNDWASNRKCVA